MREELNRSGPIKKTIAKSRVFRLDVFLPLTATFSPVLLAVVLSYSVQWSPPVVVKESSRKSVKSGNSMSKVAEDVAPNGESQGKVFTLEELNSEGLKSKDNLHMLIHGKGQFLPSASLRPRRRC